MEKSRRLYSLWNWLVPFRAVAETENLSEASEALHVASSALSRSVKLLEEQVGHPLFQREPSGLKLTAAGQHFLRAVRAAMRVLDDAMTEMDENAVPSTLTLAARGDVLALALSLLPVAGDTTVQVRELSDTDALGGLRRGAVDFALVASTAVSPDVRFRTMPALPRAVFCAPQHPWCTGGRHGEDLLADLAFGVLVDEQGMPRDGFPSDVARRIAMRTESGGALMQGVLAGNVAACVPVPVARLAALAALDVGVAVAPLSLSIAVREPVELAPSARDVRLAEEMLERLRAIDSAGGR